MVESSQVSLRPRPGSFTRSISVDAQTLLHVPTHASEPRRTSLSGDSVERAHSAPPAATDSYDSLNPAEFARYIENVEHANAARVLADVHSSNNLTRSAVTFTALCERYPELKEIERTLLIVSASTPGSLVLRRPQLLQPIFEHAENRSLDEARMIARLIGLFRADEHVVDFARIAGPEFATLPAIVRDALTRKIGAIEEPAKRREAQALLAL